MVSFASFKVKTTELKRKVSRRRNLLGWPRRHVKLDDDFEAIEDAPLLKSPPQKSTAAWGGGKSNGVSDFAIASGAIVNSLSADDTKSTLSSDMYRSVRSPREQRVEYPVIHKRDIYLSKKSVNEAKSRGESSKQSSTVVKGVKRVERKAPAIPSYSISGSMLYSNIENGNLKEGSRAAKKLKSPYKACGLTSNAVMASTLFRNMHLEESMNASSLMETKKKNQTFASHQIASRMSADSQDDDDDAPYVTIGRSNSKDGAESSVSSVTMYSSYQNDPLVRASNSLLDILRSNRFEKFDEETDSAVLFEA